MAKPGVFQTKKKNGTIYYRSSITFRGKHISLGSFSTEEQAHQTYLEAKFLLDSADTLSPDDYDAKQYPLLPYQKWISLINFKNNGFYIKTPIYLRKNFFSYHLSPTDILLFDADDLFYYSTHSIMRRGNHLFVADYGMQVNIHSRYGIRNFARLGVDYNFVNGDTKDFRYSNIEIMNSYLGVTMQKQQREVTYVAKIHIRGDYLIGSFNSAVKAAIAYNKAVDISTAYNFPKHFEKNYIEEYSSDEYWQVYEKIKIPTKILIALSSIHNK